MTQEEADDLRARVKALEKAVAELKNERSAGVVQPPTVDPAVAAIPAVTSLWPTYKRTRNALRMLGVSTLGDLANCTGESVLGLKDIGYTTLNDIRDHLAKHGLRLRDEERLTVICDALR